MEKSTEGQRLVVSRSATTKDEWLTPPDLLRRVGPFDLDPCACAPPRPFDTAALHIAPPDDGLAAAWFGRVWCNPPYGREQAKWLARCAEHGNALALVFARTETAYWHDHIWGAAHAVLFLRGRLRFYHRQGIKTKGGVHGSALVAYGRQNADTLRDCVDLGRLIRLSAHRARLDTDPEPRYFPVREQEARFPLLRPPSQRPVMAPKLWRGAVVVARGSPLATVRNPLTRFATRRTIEVR